MKQLYPALLALAVTQVLSSVQADTLDPVTIEDTVTHCCPVKKKGTPLKRPSPLSLR